MTTVYDADDPRAYDRNGALRDGVTIHVPKMMRDAAVRDRDAGRRGIIHTGDNHRPGSVFSADTNLRDASARARAEAIAEMCDAWRPKVTTDARRRRKDPDEDEDDDEIDDARLASRDAGRAVVDAQAAQEVRDAAYREYCARLQDEWRTRP
jgi:hypothetical protein